MGEIKRCSWANTDIAIKYHDNVWGKIEKNERTLFEYLVLEGAQAGLSWEMILQKESGYREVFFDYDLDKIANLTDEELDKILENKAIIRNRRKVYSVRQNAEQFLNIQKEFNTFYDYIWQFVDYKQIVNHPKDASEVPSKSELSLKISKDLKKRGFNFVGETIIYSYLQAIGVINDHLDSCSFK